MRRFFAIVILAATLAMNAGGFCKLLCLSGHRDASGLRIHAEALAKDRADVCPHDSSADNGRSRDPQRATSDASIKCGCPLSHDMSIDSAMAAAGPPDLRPPFNTISIIQPLNPIFSTTELIQPERPPEITA